MSAGAVVGALLEGAPGTTVIWQGDRITWVGPDAEARLPEDARVVRAEGATVVPGLIDCHVHVTLDGTPDGVERIARTPVPEVAIRGAQSARALLAAGITSARDCGSREGVAVHVAAAQRAGWLASTRLLAAGRGITPTGGHGWMIGVEVDGPEAVRRAVRAEIAAGADLVKLFLTGGVLGTGAHGWRPMMTLQEVEAAVDEAHRRDRKVAAHVHGPEGVELCLETGVDTVEHGTGLTEEQAERMAEQGTALVPTLTASEALRGREEVLPADVRRRMEEVREVISDSVRMAAAGGVAILAGTDAGTPFNPPGMLWKEIELLAGLGLGPAGALEAATTRAARALGLEGLGSVEPGYLADLVLVSGDPLLDPTVLRAPRLVVQAGRVVNVVEPR